MAKTIKTTALATQAVLSEAFENNNSELNHSEYLKLLQQFDSFPKDLVPASEAHDENGQLKRDIIAGHSATFGDDGFFYRTTGTEAEGRIFLEKSRAASRVMAKLSIEDRLEFLNLLEQKVGLDTSEYKEAIKTTIIADTGKPIDLAEGEIKKGGEWFASARAEAVEALSEKEAVTSAGTLSLRKRPRGAVQVVSAYNYPYALALGGIVGGLAGGNGVILSAPLKAPNWVYPFMDAAQEAIQEFTAKAVAEGKLTQDAANILKDGLIQNNIGVNPTVTTNADLVHFVGSDGVGEYIRKSRGQKPTILEMGGSNIVTVMASALEAKSPEDIAKVIYEGFAPATGQRCTAPRTLCIQEGAESVSQKLAELCDNGPKPGELGNPFKKGVKMGPLVDKGAYDKMKTAVALAAEVGATVHGTVDVSNNVVPQASRPNTYWVNPVAIDWSTLDAKKCEAFAEKLIQDKIAKDPAFDASTVDRQKLVEETINASLKDEIFGPLINIIHPVKTLEESIDKVNELDSHKLTGAIFTNNQEDVERYWEGTGVTSLTKNGSTKDRSPDGPHGHPWLDATIGGADHWKLYTSSSTIAR